MSIRNLSIRLKLSLMSLLPMLLALGFIGHDISTSYQHYTAMSRGEALNDVTLSASQLVHQLQRERSLSSGYISGNQQFADRLRHQQGQTTEQAQQFLQQLKSFNSSAYGPELVSQLNRITSAIQQLATTQRQVSERAMTAAIAVQFYSQLNIELLELTTRYSLLTEDLSVSHAATAYYFFSMAKEQAGLERAVLNEVFSRDSFSSQTSQKFLAILTREQMYEAQFLSHATPERRARVEKLLHSDASTAVQSLRDLALSRNQGFNVTASRWFNAATARIEQMKAAEDYLAEQLSQEVRLHRDENMQQLLTLISIATISALAISLISLLIQRCITGQILGLSKAIFAVETDSDLTVEAPVYSQDELGLLASHFNTMINHLRKLTLSVTEAGGKLEEMVSQVQGVAIGVNNEVSQGLDQTNLIANALEEIGHSVTQVASNCSTAAAQSDQANASASDGVTMVNSAHRSMTDLSGQIDNAMAVINQVALDSEEIGSVLDVITGIAEQTNLLALNAAIEAARAGDQGRGFAVVADEVRGLAHKTQESSARVQSMIEQLQTRSQQAVSAMQDSHVRTGSTVDGFGQVLNQLQNITQQAAGVNQMNLQNATATEQQSATVDEINRNIQDVQRSYNETSERVITLNQSASRLETLSRSLTDEVRQFRV